MDHIRHLKLIALKDAMTDMPADAQWRKIARWYSREFSTPLHHVDDLPRLDVIQAYFEDHYQNMEESELSLELQDLLKPQDALQNSLGKAQDDSSVEDLVEQAKEANSAAKAKKASLAKTPPRKEELSEDMAKALESLGGAITAIKRTVEAPGEEFNLDFQDL